MDMLMPKNYTGRLDSLTRMVEDLMRRVEALEKSKAAGTLHVRPRGDTGDWVEQRLAEKAKA